MAHPLKKDKLQNISVMYDIINNHSQVSDPGSEGPCVVMKILTFIIPAALYSPEYFYHGS